MRYQLESLIAPLLDLCRRASAEIYSLYHHPGERQWQQKTDRSPVTEADYASHELLVSGLQQLSPGVPVLSEEADCVAFEERRHWREFWLVDPLDGTREFLRRTGDITINIALVKNHRPVLGILFLPLSALAYCGIPGLMCKRYMGEGDNEGVQILASPWSDGGSARLFTGRGRSNPALQRCQRWLGDHAGAVVRRECGAALKFCHLAQGDGDIYPRFSACSEWDVAAGQAVLEAAGGAVLDLSGSPLSYNRSETLESPHFLALADPSAEIWSDLIVFLGAN